MRLLYHRTSMTVTLQSSRPTLVQVARRARSPVCLNRPSMTPLSRLDARRLAFAFWLLPILITDNRRAFAQIETLLGGDTKTISSGTFLATLRLLAHARTCETLTRDHVFIQTRPLSLRSPPANLPLFALTSTMASASASTSKEPVRPPPQPASTARCEPG